MSVRVRDVICWKKWMKWWKKAEFNSLWGKFQECSASQMSLRLLLTVTLRPWQSPARRVAGSGGATELSVGQISIVAMDNSQNKAQDLEKRKYWSSIRLDKWKCSRFYHACVHITRDHTNVTHVELQLFTTYHIHLSVVTSLEGGRPGFDFRQRQGRYFILFATESGPALEPTQPPVQRVQVLFTSGREADHSPPSSAEVKNVWRRTFTPPYVFIAR
jgi:hypothetical protein